MDNVVHLPINFAGEKKIKKNALWVGWNALTQLSEDSLINAFIIL